MSESVFGRDPASLERYRAAVERRSAAPASPRPYPCPSCGAILTSRGPDPCLGWLTGVVHACCGHGEPDTAYVVVAPGHDPNEGVCWIPEGERASFYGREAVRIFDYLLAP